MPNSIQPAVAASESQRKYDPPSSGVPIAAEIVNGETQLPIQFAALLNGRILRTAQMQQENSMTQTKQAGQAASASSAPHFNHFVLTGKVGAENFKIMYDSTTFSGQAQLKYDHDGKTQTYTQENITIENNPTLGQLVTVLENRTVSVTVLIPKFVAKSFKTVVIFAAYGSPEVKSSEATGTAELLLYQR